jgi:DNA adenine methylase
MSRITLSIKRQGGKTRLLPILLPLVNGCPHVCYCEPFSGSFTLGLNKVRAKANILNDIDGSLVNAFRQIKFHPDSLLRELEWRLNSRSELKRKMAQKPITEIQQAADYLHGILISFGGTGTSFGVAKAAGGGASNRTSNMHERLKRLSDALDGVAIESLDWQRCLSLYDSPETLFFVDPPYTTGETKAYSLFSAEEMDRLHDRLLTLKGHWVLTVDDTCENRRRFGQWITAEKSTQSGAVNKAKGGKLFKELICASWVRKEAGET